MESVLVTGATGLIGANVCKLLRARDVDTKALVRPGSDATGLEALGVEIVRGDITVEADVHRAAQGVDVIVNSAALLGGSSQDMEEQLAARPGIRAPSITLYGADDGITRPALESPPSERAVFSALVARRVIEGVGHFMPREKPEAVSSAMLELLAMTSPR